MLDLQKATLTKRASAFLFDIIIFFIAAAAAALLISFVIGYDAKFDDLQDIYEKYSDEYGIDLEITDEEFNKLTPTEKEKYQIASDAFAKDEEAAALYYLIFGLSLCIMSVSLLIPMILLEIVVPLFFKNGQTLGKKIFGIALMRSDHVKVSFFQLFVRAILGKYTIETMVPALILLMLFMGITGFIGILVIVLLLILQIIVLCVTKTNSTIHDLLSVTVVVDLNTQKIFDSSEKLMEYKKKKAEQEAQKAPY